MPKSLAVLAFLVAFASGCSHLGLKAGLFNYATDEEDLGFSDENNFSAGLGLESNLSRCFGLETDIWWDQDIQKDGNGPYDSASMLTVSLNAVLNLVPDQRPADNFLMDVAPVPPPEEDTDYPWIIAPLKWIQHGLPSVIPYVSAGFGWGHQFLESNSAVPGSDSTREEDYVLTAGAGVKINVGDHSQLRFSVDRYEVQDNQWLSGSLTRYGLTYSIPF